MTGLVRYVVADVWRSRRWVPPFFLFLCSQAILDAQGGPVLPTFAAESAVFFFLGAWLCVSVTNSEDSIQERITVAAAGGQTRVRLAKLTVAYLGCLPLIGVSLLVPPLVTSAPTSMLQVFEGAVAECVTALTGVAVGAICSRPMLKKTAAAILLTVLFGLVDSIVPAPPIGQLLRLMNEVRPHHVVLLLAGVAAEGAVLAGILVATSMRLLRDLT